MKFKNGLSLLLATTLAISLGHRAKAAVIAVVDSGTDIEHPELAQKIWNNPYEIEDGVDNDDNGYIDDLHGWNFADNNDRLLDRKLIGTFPEDDYKYFALQTKALLGNATSDDIAWLRAKVADQNFVAQLEKFANFVHGTHVAGISAKNADQAQIMVLRLIGSSATSMETAMPNLVHATDSGSAKEKLIYLGLDALAMAQGQGVAAIGTYIANEGARVANCSFGSSRAAIEPLLKPIIEKILGSTLSQDDLNKYADYFLSKTADAMKTSLIDVAKDTLYVVAAGNDGTDNDTAPTAPANSKADNEITVAATLDRVKLASFSNYGSTMVDIAAPGVGILSTVPGNEHMQISGTSQATPYVTNIAGRILDANPKLSPLEVKHILMGTVDKKDWLAGKVVSAGIANPDRAIKAAQYSTGMAVEQAITRANQEVGAIRSTLSLARATALDAKAFVLPLPSFIH